MSKRGARFSLLLALAVAVTLGIKVRATQYSLALDSAALTRAVEARLASQGFKVRHEPHGYQSDVIEATRGPCRLRVRDGALASDFSAIFAQQSAALGPIRYVYRGEWLTAPPLFRMQIDKAAAHVLARVGLPSTFPATLAIAARGCDPATIDFTGLSSRWAPKTP